MTRKFSPPRTQTRNAQRFIIVFLCALSALCSLISPAFAQESEELQLAIRRDWGYGGGAQIQGLFTLEALGPDNLATATFKIDDQVIGEIKTPPFKLQIDTDTYPPGWHDLTAAGTTSDGRSLVSASRRFEFIPAEEVWSRVQNIFLVIGGVVGILVLVMLAVTFLPGLKGKKQPTPLGAPRNYGLLGGAICPKCNRPFAISLWALNAGLRAKFTRCPYCGKWSLVSRAAPEQLRAAEMAELQSGQPETPIATPSPEEQLKRQLDESRYVDE